MAIDITKIKGYMSHEMNIIISGPAGTGKTTILREAAKQLKWNMQYYSASTLDPYTDLVGLPIPNHELKSVEYFRPKSIDEADVVFFDETNRADPKTLNTLFELIQFRSINGEPLPKLKCVVAAINPNDGNYNVDDIDPALLDRFDVYLTSEASIDFGYFNQQFGTPLAKAASQFWNEYHQSYKNNNQRNKNSMAYLSPRRMEKIVSAFVKIPKKSTIVDSLPIGANVGVDDLYGRLLAASRNGQAQTQASSSPIQKFLNMSVSELRSTKNSPDINRVINDPNSDPEEVMRLLNQLAASLRVNVGPARAVEFWGLSIAKMSHSQVRVMTSGWNTYKLRDLVNEMYAAQLPIAGYK